MANQETYITTVRLNADEAKNKLSELGKKVDELKSKKEAALKTGDLRLGDDIQKEIKKAENALKQFKMQTMSVEEILNNLPDASIDQIQKAIKSLNNQMRHLPTSSAEFKEFNEQLQLCKSALLKIKSSGEDASPALGNLSAQAKAAAGNFERAQQEAQFLYRIMHNIKGASINELNASSSILQSKMDNVSPQSATYKEYGDQLKVVKKELDLIREKQKEVNTLISQYDKEIDSAQKDMVTVRRETELVNNTLSHLSSSSVRDIEYSIKIINEQLRSMDRGTAEFKNMTEQAKRLKTELSAVRYEGAAQQSWINRTADWFNKMQGMAIGAIAAVTGLSFTIRKCTEDFADMDDEQTNVQKYTNQTKKDVREMNEDFKKVNTRTSREELNKLAEEAGRLGKTSKKDIEDFVDGADKIKVALGDDLGETAVRDIGKLAMMFGEDKTKGLRGAMYATGSAVNDLAQSSSAGAGYIVDFTARVAGIGMQAGLTQTQIMGLGSVLDQNMQQDEMAATAVSQLINKLFQDTGKMAKIAGLNVKEFSKTLKTDANAALLQFLQAMKSKGGFSALAPMFEDMKLDGQRATSVLSVMANKINDIKDAQILANKSYQQGTSVLQEFNKQNNSAKAQLEKSQKVFHDLSIELGEKLMPISRYAITTGGIAVKLLSSIIDFVFKYRTELITIIATITTYITVVKLSTLWNQKDVAIRLIKNAQIFIENKLLEIQLLRYAVLNGTMTKTVALQKLFNVVLGMNPIAAAAASAVLFVGVLAIMRNRLSAVTQNAKDVADVSKTVTDKISEEEVSIKTLVSTIRSQTTAETEKKDALAKLNGKLMEAHLNNISMEDVLTGRATKTLQTYIEILKQRITVEAYQDKYTKIIKEQLDTQNELDRLAQKYKNSSPDTYNNDDYIIYNGASQRLKTLNERAKYIENLMNESQDVMEIYKPNDHQKKQTNNHSSTYISEEEIKKREAAARRAEAAELKRKRDADKSIQAETNASLSENADQYSRGLITYEKYIDKTEEITLDGLRRRKLVWGTESNEYKNLLDDELRVTEKHDEAKRKMTEKGIERDRLIISNSLQTMFNDKNSSMYGDEDKLNEALYQNDLLALQDRLDLYKEGSEERKNIQSEIEEFEANHEIDNQQRYRERMRQYREQFGREDVALQEKIAINGLDTLHEKGLISEKEYQEMMLNMKSYYASKAAEQSAKLDGHGSKSEKFNTDVDTAINLAKAKAGDAYDPTGKNGTANPYLGQVLNYRNTMTQLNSMYAQDKNNYAIAQAAKSKVTGAFLTDMASQAQAAFDSVNNIMSAASNYYAAQSQYEQNVTTKKYDAEIQKAGENTKKGKKLKEQEEKEIAEIKTKYNKKQASIQVAQAIAQTAINAIAAYGAALQTGPAGLILAPIAAGIALAAGAIQIATIKKQQEAEESGYYEGGFTSGNDYRKKAGIVHQGEFVANHQAVNNPQLMPIFNLLDNAQRRNSVGSLTALDVSRTMGASSGVSQTVVNVPDTSLALSQMAEQQQRNSEALERLNQIIEGGIYSKVIIDGPNGFDKQYKHYQKLLQNK